MDTEEGFQLSEAYFLEIKLYEVREKLKPKQHNIKF